MTNKQSLGKHDWTFKYCHGNVPPSMCLYRGDPVWHKTRSKLLSVTHRRAWLSRSKRVRSTELCRKVSTAVINTGSWAKNQGKVNLTYYHCAGEPQQLKQHRAAVWDWIKWVILAWSQLDRSETALLELTKTKTIKTLLKLLWNYYMKLNKHWNKL